MINGAARHSQRGISGNLSNLNPGENLLEFFFFLATSLQPFDHSSEENYVRKPRHFVSHENCRLTGCHQNTALKSQRGEKKVCIPRRKTCLIVSCRAECRTNSGAAPHAATSSEMVMHTRASD